MEDLSLTIPDYIDRSNQEINDQNLNGPLEYNTEYMRDRHSRVLVNGELSEAYYIEDGIDQGEAWSPIIIMENVYDPLLTKLESVRLNTEYELDYAKISLQQNLVEKKKNNNDNENTVKEIGFWESFSYKDDRKVYVRKVTMMVEVFCAQTRWSKLTDKILISLWNTVMIPAIEYHLQAVVLMERECENILAKVNKIFKHSCNLAIGCLNAIIYDRDILKMNMINLQNTYWTAKCVGEKKNSRVSFSYDILEEMSEFDVKIEAMKKEPDLMDNASSICYRKWAKGLSYLNNKAELMVLKQLENLFVTNISYDIN
ncbi:hypothetical protein RhiirA5_423387 [Rhizophagus irregularis]|uniref:Reverse transcriptase domain-containing protein n=2 Tax=Rhizophagus irregularis TaxID=588596 RepID=A0A2N0PA37_9GLOM|nr:hypothetical protein RhiirA5_423387 [Rhizophagus irregularis]